MERAIYREVLRWQTLDTQTFFRWPNGSKISVSIAKLDRSVIPHHPTLGQNRLPPVHPSHDAGHSPNAVEPQTIRQRPIECSRPARPVIEPSISPTVRNGPGEIHEKTHD